METDKTPQEQWSALNKNEAHAPETDDQSSMDRIPTTKGNNTTPGSSADDSGKPNREGETKKSSEKSVTQSKTEDMQAPSSSNLEQESSNASAPHAKKDVDRAIHADGVINPKTEPINSKSLLTEAEPCNNNEKNNLAVPNDTSSNQINGNLNLPGQNQNTKMISHEILNKDEYRESKFTEHVARNEIRTDTEGSEDNDNNMRQDTKVDKIDEMPSSLTQSTEYSSIGKERDHEPSNDKQTNLTGIKRNQLSQGQTQSKSINDTTDMDRQDGDVKTETDKSTDKENYQDGLNRSESTKRENSEMVSEYDQIGDMQLADVTATDEKIEQDTLCQLNAKPRVRAEGPHDDSFRPKQQASEDAQLLSKQENSRIGDSEDEASPFINVFESLGEDMEIIQKDELEKEKKLSSTLEEERKIDPKDELEKEKKLSSKQREAYQREIENMKATLQQQEEEREAYQREIENMKATLQQQEEQREAIQREIEQMKTTLQQQEEQLEKENAVILKSDDFFYQMEKEHTDKYIRLQEENNTNIAKMKSLQDQGRKNELLIDSLKGENTQLKLDKQSYSTTVKQLTSQVENKDRILDDRKRAIDDLNKSLSKEKETLKQVKSHYLQQLKSERDTASAIQQNLKKDNQKLRDANDRKRKEYESKLENTEHCHKRIAMEQTQYWEAVKASLDEQIRIMAKRHDDLLHRYSKLAGESLTMGNANVTDLSDPSRPTKLGEEFSELYDNEWTDAFEELQNMSDSEKINHLLIILQRAYELSSDITTSEWLSRCYYTTFKEQKHLGISVCDKDFEATNIGPEREGSDRSKQPPTNDVHELSRDPNGDTSDITGPTNIGANKEATEQTEQSTTTDLQEHSRDSNGDIIHLSGSTNTDARREDIDRSKQTPANDVHAHSQDSSGDTSDINDPTNIGANETDTDQTEQSTTNDSHEQSPDPSGNITHLSDPTNIVAHETDTDQTTNDSHEQSPDSNGDITNISDPTQTDPKRENVDQTEQSIAKDAQEHSRDSGGDTTDFTTIEEQTADNNEKDDEQDSASGTDFQGESSVDPPSKTNKESIQIPADRTSVDPVADMLLVNKETVRVENLNLLVVEVPYGELKSEREQVAMKVLPHLKKKVLSCASEQLQQVITDCLMKEFDVPAQATNLVKFVEKCGELCLKMGLKDPPLHIDFMKEGISDQTLFNADQYKAYTKKGKYLHYVVWPCLFLEKDGPLLCKGTAQGRLD